MDISGYTRKDIGALGERITAEYLRKNDFKILERNWARKSGELDLIAIRENVIHVVEVKTVVCHEYPSISSAEDAYGPASNLHANKLRKVLRTGDWYVAEMHWEGEWQVDGVLVWIRNRDAMARVKYIPHVVTR
jgi:putative endonuclease